MPASDYDYNKRVQKKIYNAVMGIIIVIAVLVGGLIYPVFYVQSEETITVAVKEKERVASRNSSKYLIFCRVEVFECTDSLLFWKWDSSDIYGSLERGHAYRVRVVGWRLPFMSMYRNILEIECETKADAPGAR